jgi:hypothetical protein
LHIKAQKRRAECAPELSNDVLDERYVIACPDCSESNDQTHSNALDAHALSFRQKAEARSKRAPRISYVFPFRQKERENPESTETCLV